MRMRKILNDESGQVMVLTLLSMLILLGFLALAIDVGLLFRAKRNMQIAADAASTAGALDYYKEGSNTYAITAGQSAIGNAGLTGASFGCPAAASGNSPGVCVRSPATTGSHTGNGYVEVEVVQPNRTKLLGMFGFPTMSVGARSVAGLTTSQFCVYVKSNLNVQGNASLCGAAVGSTITSGFCGTGSTCGTDPTKTACGVYAGSITGSGGGGGSNCIDSQYVETHATTAGVPLNPSPAATGVPTQDPPAWVTDFNPTKGTCNMPAGGAWTLQGSGSNRVNVYTVTLPNPSVPTVSPGCYGTTGTLQPGIPDLTKPIDMDVFLQGTSGSHLNLSGGQYQFDLGTAQIGGGGSPTIGGTLNIGSYVSSLPTSGITLEIYTGNFKVASTSSNDYLYAPESASNSANGIVLWEPASNTGTINIQWGSANSAFYGYIVALGSTVTMQDQGGGAIVSGLYVGNLNLNSTLAVTNYGASVSSAPGKNIALVE